jgi:hypothetical protein
VDKKKFSELGADEFRRCATYVAQMSHVKEKDFEIGGELSSTVFWRLKKVLITVVWGICYTHTFPTFLNRSLSKTAGNFL